MDSKRCGRFELPPVRLQRGLGGGNASFCCRPDALKKPLQTHMQIAQWFVSVPLSWRSVTAGCQGHSAPDEAQEP